MKSLYALAAVTLLAGCQSTQTSAPVKTKNYVTAQDVLEYKEKMVAELGSTASIKEKYELGILYSMSYDQATRKKGLPLITEAAESGNPQAAFSLIANETLGSFGYVSNDSFPKYKDQLNEKELKIAEETYSKTNPNYLHFVNNFDAYQSSYVEYQSVCAQPLDAQPVDITKTRMGYMQFGYVKSCLEKYATKESAKRLAALSALAEAACDKSSDTVCVAEGYKALSLSDINASSEKSIAYSLRKILDTHKRYLRPTIGNPKRYPARRHTAEVFLQAADDVEAENYDLAISKLLNLFKDKSLPAYDRAFVNNYIGKIYYVRKADGDRKSAIRHINFALDSNQLGLDDHYESLRQMFDMLILDGQYKEAISQISSFIIKNQKDFDLIPVATMTAINAYVNPQKQTTAAPAI